MRLCIRAVRRISEVKLSSISEGEPAGRGTLTQIIDEEQELTLPAYGQTDTPTLAGFSQK